MDKLHLKDLKKGVSNHNERGIYDLSRIFSTSKSVVMQTLICNHRSLTLAQDLSPSPRLPAHFGIKMTMVIVEVIINNRMVIHGAMKQGGSTG